MCVCVCVCVYVCVYVCVCVCVRVCVCDHPRYICMRVYKVNTHDATYIQRNIRLHIAQNTFI